ncbi:MAG: ThiF family adenylyltransferase [Verrucomicrobiales bacterium]
MSRLKDLNPDVRITPVAENLSAGNAENLIKGVDLVVDAAPLFEERLAMNDAAFRQGKPLAECHARHGGEPDHFPTGANRMPKMPGGSSADHRMEAAVSGTGAARNRGSSWSDGGHQMDHRPRHPF